MVDTTSTRPPFAARRGTAEPTTPYLRLVYAEGLGRDAPELGTLTPLGAGELVIGRRPDAPRAVALPWDGWASRQNTRVRVLGGSETLVVTDLDSRNGTYVDRERLTPGASVQLAEGGVLRVGGTLFVAGRGRLTSRARLLQRHPPPAWLPVWSEASVELWTALSQVASSDAGVLLYGEMGTGKTRLAELLHQLGPRADGPFVAFNCSAIPHHLEEATLFGVVGGFIPGVKAKRGWLSMARDGTLFLDELAELPPLAQAKLLDAFDTRDPGYRPVGSEGRERTDCRLISATNRDVMALAARGDLRQDLLSRLVVMHIEVPPLRARREELLHIAGSMLAARSVGEPTEPVVPAAEVAEALLLAPWTENVRGLETLLTRLGLGQDLTPEAVTAHAGRGTGRVDPESPAPLPPAVPSPSPPSESLTWPPPRPQLLELLARHAWSVKDAAAELGRRSETLSRLLTSQFGRRGREVAQRAHRVWKTSGRLPQPEHVPALHALYFEDPDTPATRQARQRWQEQGEVPSG